MTKLRPRLPLVLNTSISNFGVLVTELKKLARRHKVKLALLETPPSPAPSNLAPIRPICMPTASGRPMLVADEIPRLEDGLGAVFAFAVAQSSSIMDAIRALGLSGPRELRLYARRFKVRLPWKARKKEGLR